MELSPGAYLAERFQILDTLKQGETHALYLAADRTNQVALGSLQVLVGIKVFDHTAMSPGLLKAECRILSDVKHENLLQVFDVIRDEESSAVSIEHLEASLLSEVAERRVLSGKEVLNILRKIAGGLESLHQAGLVHGSLSEECIYYSENGTLKIDPLARELGNHQGPQKDIRDLGNLGLRLLTAERYKGGRFMAKLKSWWFVDVAPPPDLQDLCLFLASAKYQSSDIGKVSRTLNKLWSQRSGASSQGPLAVSLVFSGRIFILAVIFAIQALFFCFGVILGFHSR